MTSVSWSSGLHLEDVPADGLGEQGLAEQPVMERLLARAVERVAGIRSLLPEVNGMRPVHDLRSQEQLVRTLTRSWRRAGRAAPTAL